MPVKSGPSTLGLGERRSSDELEDRLREAVMTLVDGRILAYPDMGTPAGPVAGVSPARRRAGLRELCDDHHRPAGAVIRRWRKE